VMGLMPMLILATLNWLIYRAVSSARAHHVTLMSMSSSSSHRRDNTMSTVLTSIVLIFVICHTPKAILNLYEVYQDIFHPFEEKPELKLFLDIVINISHLLIVTNSAVNIVVYFLKDFKFRAVLWSLCGGSRSRIPGHMLRNNTKCISGHVKQENNIKIHFLGISDSREQDPVALSCNTNTVELTNLVSPDVEEKKLLQTDL